MTDMNLLTYNKFKKETATTMHGDGSEARKEISTQTKKVFRDRKSSEDSDEDDE
jgi:hypothetical protein